MPRQSVSSRSESLRVRSRRCLAAENQSLWWQHLIADRAWLASSNSFSLKERKLRCTT
jgi:hypothetical protein